MADRRHIENRFWLYLGALLADQRDEESNADIGHVTAIHIAVLVAKFYDSSLIRCRVGLMAESNVNGPL